MSWDTTRMRSFRCEDSIWQAARAKADAQQIDLSTVLRELLTGWIAAEPAATIEAAESR